MNVAWRIESSILSGDSSNGEICWNNTRTKSFNFKYVQVSLFIIDDVIEVV